MKYLFFLLFIPFFLFAKLEDPWYTGPLITPSAHNLDPGLYNIQPYIFVLDTFGRYNRAWKREHFKVDIITVNLSLSFQRGLLDWLDATLDLEGYRSGSMDEIL